MLYKHNFKWLCLVSTLFISLSCSPKAATRAPEVQKPPSPANISEGKKGAESEWEIALQRAKKEGNLTIYTSLSPDIRDSISKAANKKFGFNVEIVSAAAPELVEKTMRERRAGINRVDLFISGIGTTTFGVLKKAGLLKSIEREFILPEVKDSQYWYMNKLPFLDKEKLGFAFRTDMTQVLLINSNTVKKEDISSYRNLLDAKWKGKIIMHDPTVAGTGHYAFRVVGGEFMGFDFWRNLVKNELSITRDRRLLVESVTREKFLIGIGSDNRMVREFNKAGAPLKLLNPGEGGYLTSGIGNIFIFDGAPSPNALKVFVNWFLSKEGQTLYSQAAEEQSARMDVPTEHLSPDIVRPQGIKLFNTLAHGEEWLIGEKAEKDMILAQEIFGPLLR